MKILMMLLLVLGMNITARSDDGIEEGSDPDEDRCWAFQDFVDVSRQIRDERILEKTSGTKNLHYSRALAVKMSEAIKEFSAAANNSGTITDFVHECTGITEADDKLAADELARYQKLANSN